MSKEAVDIFNAATLEKLVLTQRVGRFLSDEHSSEERVAIEKVAFMLAQDVSQQVREALAFELRTCKLLPHELACKIASDVETVASPFLRDTPAFSDQQLADLIPQLEEHAHITISRRGDLGPKACMAIISVGSGKCISFLIRNDRISLDHAACNQVVDRFSEDRKIMNDLSRRADLPLSVVERIIEYVSAESLREMVARYGVAAPLADEITRNARYEAMWRQIEKASPNQVHAFVIELKRTERLTPDMVLEFAERGCLSFLESTLALDAGLTLGAVREGLYGGDMKAFVRLMQEADVSKALAHEYYQVVSNSVERPE